MVEGYLFGRLCDTASLFVICFNLFFSVLQLWKHPYILRVASAQFFRAVRNIFIMVLGKIPLGKLHPGKSLRPPSWNSLWIFFISNFIFTEVFVAWWIVFRELSVISKDKSGDAYTSKWLLTIFFLVC